MNLAAVMDDLGTQLATISGLRVFPYSADRVTPPAAVVMWPDQYDFDATMARGGDRVTMPVTVLTGRVVERAARDELAAYADGSGERSIKAVLEAGAYTAFDSCRVTGAQFAVTTIASVDYLSAEFSVDIIGLGDEGV